MFIGNIVLKTHNSSWTNFGKDLLSDSDHARRSSSSIKTASRRVLRLEEKSALLGLE